MRLVLLLLFIVKFIPGNIAQDVAVCEHRETNTSGTCKNIHHCPSAAIALSRNKLIQFCDTKMSTVCCPPETPIDTTPVGARSRAKCREYSAYVYNTYQSPTLGGGRVRYKTRDECGFKSIPLVIGGEKAKPKEFPHMAAIGYDRPAEDGGGIEWLCGGSLLSERFVLTAAHCYAQRARHIRVGDLNLRDNNDIAAPQTVAIDEFIQHPAYNSSAHYNDIALIRLKEVVNFTVFVRPICLTTQTQPETRAAIASGWGSTGHSEEGSDDLRKVTLEWYTHADCDEFHAEERKLKQGIREESQICAGSKTSDLKDTCFGDSGGPLQIFHSDLHCMYTIVGITSFGQPCDYGVAMYNPAVYTRVAYFVDWIETIVWP